MRKKDIVKKDDIMRKDDIMKSVFFVYFTLNICEKFIRREISYKKAGRITRNKYIRFSEIRRISRKGVNHGGIYQH
ncbi:MAG: hypothetical protein AYK18_17060 [Theionarchaea archaeon DG-70]|nr:MAG: hypothetical protein AYK18_17060 [Theionarchaea archaeon DG-70]